MYKLLFSFAALVGVDGPTGFGSGVGGNWTLLVEATVGWAKEVLTSRWRFVVDAKDVFCKSNKVGGGDAVKFLGIETGGLNCSFAVVLDVLVGS